VFRLKKLPVFSLAIKNWFTANEMTLKNVLLICCLLNLAFSPLNGAELLRSLSSLRNLSEDLAQQEIPIQVEATVLYADSSGFDMIVHDGAVACYCSTNLRDAAVENRPRIGDRIWLEGNSNIYGFLPHIQTRQWKILGHHEIPSPYPISAEEIFLPRFDTTWVEVPAVVVGVETGGLAYTVVVEVFGQTFKVDTPKSEDSSARAAALMQRPVMMRGILATIFNRHRQLTGRHFFVPSFDCFTPTAPAVDAAKARHLHVNELLRSSSSPHDLVRLEGVITQHDAKGFYLKDATGSAFVQGVKSDDLPVGTRVSVEGYGAIAPFRPMLRAIQVSELDRGLPSIPMKMNFQAEDASLYQMELVAVEAEFWGSRTMSHETILQCSSQGIVFDALLPDGASMADLVVGDRLLLTGICELTTTHPMPRPEWVNGFRIRLADARAVQVLHRAPWWTTGRLLMALGAMTGLAMLGAFGTLFFRRVVHQQAMIIGEKLSSEAVSEERDRMARDLHDTLEQQLTGVSMQLESIVQSPHAKSSAVTERLALATRMLEHSRQEARRSVWDLRNRLLETHGLAAALKSLAASAAIDGGPVVTARVMGDAMPMTTTCEYQLLRMAQEALANALKHARAKHIEIVLEFFADRCCLLVRDDGVGFDPQLITSSPVPHFGWIGMRERADKIAANLQIISSPDHGCTVCIELPISTKA
jgi:signal transduction histidine kinase